MRLKDKVALITGSGRGIGRGIVERFAEEGAHVVINDILEEHANEAVSRITGAGGKATAVIANVSKESEVDKMVAGVVKEHGRIDILVNNAGVLRDNYIQNISEEDWDYVLDINLKGPFFCIRAASKHMRDRKYGKIVNISSRAFLGNRGQANYSASKGGLVSLTRAMAIELARFQINVNCIAPGLIDTPLIRSLREDIQKELISLQPTGKIGTPRDIANAALFLSSDEAEYITGQVFMVDGGKSLGAKFV